MWKNQRRHLILAFVTVFALVGCAQKPEVQEDTSDSDVVGSDTVDSDTTRQGLANQNVGSGVGTDMDAAAAGSDSAMPSENVVYFDFDSSQIGQETRDILSAHAAYLAANPGLKVRVEGHADERGTREYNMALGERRANAVTEVLTLMGTGSDRLEVVSYGEEKPVALGHDEYSYQLNRRVELIY